MNSIRNNLTSWLLALIICINAGLIYFYFVNFIPKKREARYANKSTNYSRMKQSSQVGQFNSPCPDFSFHTDDGQSFRLSNLVGDVIVFRFYRPHPLGVPQLIYLDHLYEKLRAYGIHMFFIKAMHNYDYLFSSSPKFTSPSVEDGKDILSYFRAMDNDIIIIGRDFRIKFKQNLVPNMMIYNQIRRFLFENSSRPPQASKSQLSSVIKKLKYLDIKTGKIEKIHSYYGNLPILLTLMVAPCFGCGEHQRISMMKQIASKSGGETQFVLLLGRGNDPEIVRKLLGKTDATGDITVGIVEDQPDLSKEEYYSVFRLDIDPYSVILDRNGEITYVEEEGDARKLTDSFLQSKLK